MDERQKPCSKCRKLKPLSEFYRATGMKDGYRSDCKSCNLAAKHARYRADPEPTKQRVREWQKANPERVKANRTRRRQRPEVKLKEREDHLRRKYGITQADYEALLAKQGGGCAICGRKPSKISLHVDHVHGSDTIRGLLCFRCNNALGDLGDSPEQLARAIDYLTRDERLDALIRARVERELLRQQ